MLGKKELFFFGPIFGFCGLQKNISEINVYFRCEKSPPLPKKSADEYFYFIAYP
jgi:hypothetical protein